MGEGAAEGVSVGVGVGEAKRPRLLERLARPFRTTSTPLPARRAAEVQTEIQQLFYLCPIITINIIYLNNANTKFTQGSLCYKQLQGTQWGKRSLIKTQGYLTHIWLLYVVILPNDSAFYSYVKSMY